ncbi:MAG: TM1266 family iron-only hydrogenase system putative regulator [Bacillota bacterium]|jgi:putative iron-only hydrogenase system regulator|nr:CopG family transcriptional regulator [Candidatus Fermentithermobacillaceae bacterium]
MSCDRESVSGTGGRQVEAGPRRIGVVGIVVTERLKSAPRVNQVLSDYAHIIIGRMGIPYRERGISVIALIVDGDTDTLGAMTGKLGGIPGVKVRTAITV